MKQEKSLLDKMNMLAEEMRVIIKRLASLEQDAWQPCLAMEIDEPTDKKARERTEGAAKAVQAMHKDICSPNRVDPDPMHSTPFGDDCTGPPALPCSRDDILTGNGAAAPKPCLLSLEMCSPTAAGGLLPIGKISTATKTTFHQLPLWFGLTEETNLMASIL